MHPSTVSSCTSLEPASSDATKLKCTDFLHSDDSVPEVNKHIRSDETSSDDDLGERMSSGL